jgi:hypothetical protein
MNLCSDGHDEICHEGRKCPVCELIKEHEKNAEVLEDKITGLESEIEDLKGQIP